MLKHPIWLGGFNPSEKNMWKIVNFGSFPEVYRGENSKKKIELPPPSGCLIRILYTICNKNKPKFTSKSPHPLAPCLVINWHFALAIFPIKVGGWKWCFRDQQVVWSCKQQKTCVANDDPKDHDESRFKIRFTCFSQTKMVKIYLWNEMNRYQKFRGFGKCIIGVIWGNILVKRWYRGIWIKPNPTWLRGTGFESKIPRFSAKWSWCSWWWSSSGRPMSLFLLKKNLFHLVTIWKKLVPPIVRVEKGTH